MKTALLSAAALTLLVCSSLAQENPQPPRRIGLPPSAPGNGAPASAEAPAEAARFDLKFPGGKVKEFVAAVSKALGKPVNVIIPKEGEGTMIPAVDVSRVTVDALFSAMSIASQHEVGFPTNVATSSTGVISTNIQYRMVGFTFRTEEKNSPDGVWTFSVKDLPENLAAKPFTPPRSVQYYPVAEYLTHFSVEDITTAIESGWKLQGLDADSPATIRFHEETKLLICAGTTAQIELIPQVLKGLSQMLRYPRSENLKITRKAGGIIVPKLDFKEATPREAVDFMRRKSAELDPEKQGFNIVLRLHDGAPERKITLALSNVPALEALKYIATLSGLDLEIEDHAIVLNERPRNAAPAFAPVSPEAFPLPGFPTPSAQPAPPSPSAH
jgi:hypothetical protein